MERNLLFGSHNILIAWAKYLVDFWYRLRTIGHCSNSLNTTYLKNLIDSSHMGGGKNGGIDVTLAVGRSAEHYLAATCNPGRSGKHKHRGEERSRATGDI